MNHLGPAPQLTGRAWLGTGGHALDLAALRGRVVLLDFWTFCCVNCLHVLDELRALERQYPDTLVIIGVHSPKFPHEATPAALAAAIRRYQVDHPVLDDPDLTTWQAYGARAWPTLVLIDPEGNLVAHLSGEGHGAALSTMVGDLVAQHRAKGTLISEPVSTGALPEEQPPVTGERLTFPSKAITLPSGHLLIVDAGAHRLVETTLEGGLVGTFGSGERGLVNAPAAEARFSEPNGLCLLPPQVAARVGVDVVVADTVNHALRGLSLDGSQVSIVAGTGCQRSGAQPGPPLVHGGAAALCCDLSSPWDVAWDSVRGLVLIAMAGVHQIWGFDPIRGLIGVVAGTSGEGLVDGDGLEAWLAQPSGLAIDQNGRCWFVDSETSALRYLDMDDKVGTAVGQGLFDFGLVDGRRAKARLQHPLGLGLSPCGRMVLVADTYNGAIRLFDPRRGKLSTVEAGLDEPSDILLHPDLAPGQVLAVESGAHRLAVIQVGGSAGHQGACSAVAAPPPAAASARLARPPLELPAGHIDLEIAFTVPPGRALDESTGYATQVTVSASPPELILQGAGLGHQLTRRLELAPGRGVLHVTARVATCDTGTSHPACHLNAQDWGLPVAVSPGSARPARIDLPLG